MKQYAIDEGGRIIQYEGEYGTDSWFARSIDADEYDGDPAQLPSVNDPNLPWKQNEITEEDQRGNEVVLQHLIKEKKAELQWDSSTQYHVDDVVYHNGVIWKATSNNSNNEPDDVPGDWEAVS